MAPKKSELSEEVKTKIVLLNEQGSSFREIAKKLKLSVSTVHYVVKKYKETGTTQNRERTGRPKVLSARNVRFLVNQVKKNHFETSENLAKDLATSSGVSVTPQTIRNCLHDKGIRGRAPRKKPFISEVNRVKRLEFAKEYVNYPVEFWDKIIFSDESKFNLFGSDGKRWVWRSKNTELKASNLKPTIKHGGGHLMVWGCMAASGVGNLAFINGVMNARQYIDILAGNLSQSVDKLNLNGSFYFQQDNDPKHTAHITREWLLYNAPRRLLTPPQSPDLNPIENLWSILDSKIRKNKFSNKSAMKTVILEEWEKIGSKYTKELVHSMPRRLQAVINAKGLHTKY